MSAIRPEPASGSELEFTPDAGGYKVTKGGRILGCVWKDKQGWRHDRHRWFRFHRREDAGRSLLHFVELELEEVVP